MNNFLIAVAVFLITVLGALFAVPYLIDWNGYRAVFEEEASRMLGRDVRIAGNVNLHFLPTPYFSLEKVRIADAAQGLPEPLFRADSVTIKLAVPPLLRGAVEANEVELKRPVLRLAIDKDDRWNWQSLASAVAQAAYLPSSVALASVRVSGGMLAVHGPDGRERMQLPEIEAELSSPALDGPYRVRATYGTGGQSRELRLATAKPEADGSFRVKATLRAGDTGSSYALDARVANPMGNILVEGELTAKLPFAGIWPTGTRAAADDAFDVKAQVKADASGLTLGDLSLSFERDGQPQIVSGSLAMQWRGPLDVDAKLASRWLDLDRLAGASKTTAGPLDSALPFAQRLRELLPPGQRARAALSIDQANIGREAVSGVTLVMVRTGDRVEIEDLRAGMPGGARGELKGILTGTTAEPGFTGVLSLRGSSLARFVAWASGGALSGEGAGDGTFALRTDIGIEKGQAVLRSVGGELSGIALNGAGSYRWSPTQQISLQLEGPQIDARALIPAGADLGDMLRLLTAGSGADSGPRKASRLAGADFSLRVTTGTLLTAGATYRDVALSVERSEGTLKIPALRLASADGFLLDLEGDVQNTATQPKGTLRVTASAETAAGLQPLIALIGVPASARPDPSRLQGLAPLRIAGTLAFGARLPHSIDIAARGEANGGPVNLAARLDGAGEGWREGPADVTLSIDNPDAAQIASLVLPTAGVVQADSAPTARTQPGRILVRGAGVPARGMPLLVALEAGPTTLGFRGQFESTTQRTRITGDLDIANADGARLAALARLSPPLRLGAFPVSGTVRFATDGTVTDVERLALSIGGVDLRGRLRLKDGDRSREVDATLETDAIALADMLSPVLDRRLGAATAAAEAALADRPSIWPEQPFDRSTFAGFTGTVTLRTPRLTLSGPLGLDRATLTARWDAGKIVVQKLAGEALGAQWTTAFTLQPGATDAEVAGTLQVDGLEAGRVVAGAKGRLKGQLAFKGRGASPRIVMAGLDGQGTLAADGVTVPGLSPAALAVAVDQALKASVDTMSLTLRKTLTVGLGSAVLPLPAHMPLDLAEGMLRTKGLTLGTAAGTATGSLLVDLGSFALISDWKLAMTPTAGGRALPAAGLVYRGPVAALGRLEPQLDVDALERELTVRRMERDVDELERLRRLDEARRKEEAARQQLQQQRPADDQPSQQQPDATQPRANQPKASFKSPVP